MQGGREKRRDGRIPATMRKDGIAVLIGAGASNDCTDADLGEINPEFRPPLAVDLFVNRPSFNKFDFMNPAPDMDVNSLTPFYFKWVVEHMADMAIRLAKKPRKQSKDLRWDKVFTATRKK